MICAMTYATAGIGKFWFDFKKAGKRIRSFLVERIKALHIKKFKIIFIEIVQMIAIL